MVQRAFEPRPAEGLNYPNVMQMFAARIARSPDLPALRHKQDGAWRTLTWKQWDEAARQVAAGLVQELGIERGERVAIMARTRLEWALCDTAIAMAGAVSVPIYGSQTAEQATHILQDSGAVAVIVEHPEHMRRLATPDCAERIRGLRGLIYMDEEVVLKGRQGGGSVTLADVPKGLPACVSLGRVRNAGATPKAETLAALDSAQEELGLDDEFTYVYTAGTTGVPKGVVLSHKNLVYESWAVRNVIPVDSTDEQLMVLPLAHIFARHLLWGAVEQGAVTAFAESPDAVSENLREVAPTYMGAVPRTYEKVHTRLQSDASSGPRARQALFGWALDVGRKVSVCKQRGQVPSTALSLKMAAAQRLVFDRIQGFFGGRLRFFVSGGAPLSRQTAEFFHATGILILEGYGLTETTGATNVNRPDRFRFGTVGPAMPGCEIRVAEDGEVLIRGHNVMKGYHDAPKDTDATIDEQGWLHTGDIGEIRDGFLRITDRKKDLIVTSGAKHIAPQAIERQLDVKEGVAHAMIHGDRRPHAVALVALDESAMLRVSEREGLGCRSYTDLAAHPRVRQLVQGYIDEVNSGLAPWERVKTFELSPAPFGQATGELTPTHELRREAVRRKYAKLLDRLYDGSNGET